MNHTEKVPSVQVFDKNRSSLEEERRRKSAVIDDMSKFGAAARSYIRRQRSVTAVNEQVVLLRSQVRYERKEFNRKCQLVVDSLQVATDDLARRTKPSATAKWISNLDSLIADKNDLFELEIKMAGLDVALQDLESNLQAGLDLTLREAMKSVNILIDMDIALPADATITVPERSTTTSVSYASSTHPLLKDHHDATTFVRIMQERLRDIDLDYVEDCARRNHEEEQGMLLAIPDEAFHEAHRTQRRNIAVELEKALHAKDLAMKACLDAGIDVEGHKKLKTIDSESLSPRDPIGGEHMPLNLDFLDSEVNTFPRIQVRDEGDPMVATTLEPPPIDIPDASGEHSWDMQHRIESWMDQSQLATNYFTGIHSDEEGSSTELNAPVHAVLHLQAKSITEAKDRPDQRRSLSLSDQARQNRCSSFEMKPTKDNKANNPWGWPLSLLWARQKSVSAPIVPLLQSATTEDEVSKESAEAGHRKYTASDPG